MILNFAFNFCEIKQIETYGQSFKVFTNRTKYENFAELRKPNIFSYFADFKSF